MIATELTKHSFNGFNFVPPQIVNRPLEEKGTFHFPPLANGTTYFSENNQSNCCDY